MDCVPPWDESCALAVTSPNRVARVNKARKDLMCKSVFFINAVGLLDEKFVLPRRVQPFCQTPPERANLARAQRLAGKGEWHLQNHRKQNRHTRGKIAIH